MLSYIVIKGILTNSIADVVIYMYFMYLFYVSIAYIIAIKRNIIKFTHIFEVVLPVQNPVKIPHG